MASFSCSRSTVGRIVSYSNLSRGLPHTYRQNFHHPGCSSARRGPSRNALQSQTRHQSAYAAAVSAAQSISSPPPEPPSGAQTSASQKAHSPFEPIPLISDDLNSLRTNIMMLLGSGHPSLDSVAKHYFQAEGKHIRPLIVLLMSAATNNISPVFGQGLAGSEESDLTGVDEPLSPMSVLNDYNPNVGGSDANPHSNVDMSRSKVLSSQRRLAEISEMIHVASLLHDDVIDESALRRGAPSSPAAFGNKLSILGGDFLLGRASVALARLRDNEVVELLATVIANLVEGEVMQMKGVDVGALAGSGLASFWTSEEALSAASSPAGHPFPGPTPEHFTSYLQKTYLKTASLMAKSSRAATILGGHGESALSQWRSSRLNASDVDHAQDEAVILRSKEIRDSAYAYGRNLGIAFQLVDDLLDFQSTSVAFGKPSGGADLRLGLATAPVLYAWQEFPGPEENMKEMVERKFEGDGDVEKALATVHKSQGLARTAALARHHADEASRALAVLPASEASEALQCLVTGVLQRVK